jgi:hypothetical protein
MRGVIAFLVTVLLLLAPTASAGVRGLQHVTLIGDSVADSLPGTSTAIAILRQGIDLDLEVAPCRRVDQDSCPYNGVRPPNLVQLVNAMGTKLGPNVVVAVGYNDFEDQYAQNIEDALNALNAAGVKRVYWLTLRAAHHGYVNMNDDIVAAAAKHPELRVIDWNVYSRSHPDWFQDDGLHLLMPGAEAMATLIHQTLLDDGLAVPPVQVATTSLPVAHRGKPYHAQLGAASGLAPYRWSVLERAPTGIHLEPSGLILGTPRAKLGLHIFDVQVQDSSGTMATRRLTLRIVG